MSNFTQGKWKVVQGAGVDEFDVISKDAPLHNCICVLFVYPTSRRDEQKANARLIAAAPEMYALLDWLVGGHGSVNTAEELFDAFVEMRLLLARIDGKGAVHE